MMEEELQRMKEASQSDPSIAIQAPGVLLVTKMESCEDEGDKYINEDVAAVASKIDILSTAIGKPDYPDLVQGRRGDSEVFPIFYDVDPSDVRNQKGSLEEAFVGHQMLQRDNKVLKSWRESLTKVANLSGWDCKDRPEAELIETVVEELWTKLRPKLPPYFKDLIGIENKIEQLEPLLEIGLNDVWFVGIWGLPGVGKTTIARAVFEKYHSQFEIKCFLHNVRATSERDGEGHCTNKVNFFHFSKLETWRLKTHSKGRK
ncbi:hypothetical protein K1719_018045 [Acacia pycnantha]|nr:hypothetical protein K1719_018045 [Acacia pycnantha]